MAGAQHTHRTGDIHEIRHVIVIMEENRSFDSFFGTYPGADGIPRRHGVPTVCVPNGVGQCVKPFLDRAGADDSGGRHGPLAGREDVDGGRMDGFIRLTDGKLIRACRRDRHSSACVHLRHPNVMSYHNGAQIPNYWAYARHFVLQDHYSSRTGAGACRRTSGSSRAGRRSAAIRTRQARVGRTSRGRGTGRARRSGAIPTARSTAGPT